MRLRRSAPALIGVAAAALVAAFPAAAKEDVRATLTSHVTLDAPAGTQVAIAWALFSVDENGRRQPFGANGVFVRLLSASGAAPEEAVSPIGSYDTGQYEATVLVPEGGIREVELGLQGWVSDANGTRRSDLIFTITNDPVPNPAPISSLTRDSPGAGSANGTPSWLLALTAGLLSVLVLPVGTLLIRKRRRHNATAPAERVLRRTFSTSVSSRA